MSYLQQNNTTTEYYTKVDVQCFCSGVKLELCNPSIIRSFHFCHNASSTCKAPSKKSKCTLRNQINSADDLRIELGSVSAIVSNQGERR